MKGIRFLALVLNFLQSTDAWSWEEKGFNGSGTYFVHFTEFVYIYTSLTLKNTHTQIQSPCAHNVTLITKHSTSVELYLQSHIHTTNIYKVIIFRPTDHFSTGYQESSYNMRLDKYVKFKMAALMWYVSSLCSINRSRSPTQCMKYATLCNWIIIFLGIKS